MFHVPEFARLLHGPLASTPACGNNGTFFFRSKVPGREIWCRASDSLQWEHVSLHVTTRTPQQYFAPTWDELCAIKALFWDADDVVMQLHLARATWLNTHPAILHLWKPRDQVIPLPPRSLVGLDALEARTQHERLHT
jgi:hypothetical protein